MFYVVHDTFIYICQIVHWKTCLNFPEQARLTPEAKDLICRLLCDVEHRLGTKGADQIKVFFFIFNFYSLCPPKNVFLNTFLFCPNWLTDFYKSKIQGCQPYIKVRNYMKTTRYS